MDTATVIVRLDEVTVLTRLTEETKLRQVKDSGEEERGGICRRSLHRTWKGATATLNLLFGHSVSYNNALI